MKENGMNQTGKGMNQQSTSDGTLWNGDPVRVVYQRRVGLFMFSISGVALNQRRDSQSATCRTVHVLNQRRDSQSATSLIDHRGTIPVVAD